MKKQLLLVKVMSLQGYAPDDLKYAYFTGADLQDTFSVYRQKDKQVVYQGSIQRTGETAHGTEDEIERGGEGGVVESHLMALHKDLRRGG